MTDHKDDLAPDYIWAMREVGSDDMDAGTFCSVDDGGTKYIRSDLAQSQIKAAEAAAYRKAAAYAENRHGYCMDAFNMARSDEVTVKVGCESRAKEALNICNAIRAMKEGE